MRTKKKPLSWSEIKQDPDRLKYMRMNFVKLGLRRLSYRWPGRYNAANASKIGRNEYVCESCGIVTGRKNIQLDHKIPVVLTTGWDNFDGFVERLFCTEEGYSTLCKECHQEKSLKENEERRELKK